MAFQPAPAVAQAVMRYGIVSQGVFSWANVLHFVHNGGTAWTAAELQALGDALSLWWINNLAIATASVYGLLSIELRGMESQEAAYASLTVNDAGDAAGDPLPINTAAVITLSTAFTGRSARGRIYHAGLAESQSSGSALLPAVVTTLNAAYGLLVSDFPNDTAGSLCVLSRTANGVPRVTASPYVVTDASLRDAVLDTQRRRIERLK